MPSPMSRYHQRQGFEIDARIRLCLRGLVSKLCHVSVRFQLYVATIQMMHRTNSVGDSECEEKFDIIMIV